MPFLFRKERAKEKRNPPRQFFPPEGGKTAAKGNPPAPIVIGASAAALSRVSFTDYCCAGLHDTYKFILLFTAIGCEYNMTCAKRRLH